MAIEGTSGTSGIPEMPVLRSALSGRSVRTGRSPQAEVPAEDRADTSARLATAIRRNHAFLRDIQTGVTASRIALGALDRLLEEVETLTSGRNSESGVGSAERLAEAVREAVDRAAFGGRKLLSELAPEKLGLAEERPAPESLHQAVQRMEGQRYRILAELEAAMKSLAAAEVERANLFAASGTGTLTSSAQARGALQEATARLGSDPSAAVGSLDHGRVMQIL